MHYHPEVIQVTFPSGNVNHFTLLIDDVKCAAANVCALRSTGAKLLRSLCSMSYRRQAPHAVDLSI